MSSIISIPDFKSDVIFDSLKYRQLCRIIVLLVVPRPLDP